MLVSHDVYSQLRPRHVCRRERKPGARERHSAQRQRHSQDSEVSKQKQTLYPNQTVSKSSYSMNSAVSDFNRNRKTETAEHESTVTTSYRELSTIEAIRANMKATSKPKSAAPEHVPAWMLNLDINLDVTSIDIIPPFDDGQKQNDLEMYTESPSLTFLETDSVESGDFEIERSRTPGREESKRAKTTVQASRPASRQSQRELSPKIDRRPLSNTFRIAGGFSPSMNESGSPRRYQGDKKVMSMQQGGIRSTPFQPKSKKFINQMITYRHMKHHDMKIKKAKPAIDTKMPTTFKIALDRKHTVEQRLSDTWSRTSTTPTRETTPTGDATPTRETMSTGDTPRTLPKAGSSHRAR